MRPLVARTVLVGALGVLAVGGLVMMGLSTDLFGRAPPGLDRVSAAPNEVAVIDGDTLRLEGQVIRLHGVEAPDRGDRCRGDLDCGGAATAALAGLVRDRRVECRMTGRDSAGRPYAACDAEGTDLSRAIVASGWARARSGVPELADLELRARRQGAGLWADARSH
ncbi:MAG: thermonuclease family protein [Acetobacteraceae bacterium]|nr:thermonuclease family protein [Acetobacteraceae bacterium]